MRFAITNKTVLTEYRSSVGAVPPLTRHAVDQQTLGREEFCGSEFIREEASTFDIYSA
jgi:hypothetical protein